MSVSCNMLPPLRACCSLALEVWPFCCRSSLHSEEECVSSLFPFDSWIRPPQTKHCLFFFFTTKPVLLSGLCTTNTPQPPRPCYSACSWVASGSVLRPLLLQSSPTQVKGIEEQLGRLLFWHSLYVLLIGANWHRGAPLFLCIIRPSSPRREERAQTKAEEK